MPKYRMNPPLPKSPSQGTFVQTIELLEDGRTIGQARWHVGPGFGDGVIQLLEMEIAPPHRRQGHGGRLLQAVIEQARRHHQAHGGVLRRIWIGVEQKSQIAARAFLTENGFHHISTLTGLLKDQDLLFYIRSLN